MDSLTFKVIWKMIILISYWIHFCCFKDGKYRSIIEVLSMHLTGGFILPECG